MTVRFIGAFVARLWIDSGTGVSLCRVWHGTDFTKILGPLLAILKHKALFLFAMVLRAGYLAVALKLQEAASDLSAQDVRTRLSDAINDAHRGTNTWAYYIDHFGDGESGDVIYSCDGDTMRCPYAISGGGASAAVCTLDMESAEDVVPRTIYEPEADEADHYAAMEEALKKEKLYAELPVYERFISKPERDKASSSDFAGKGKSFPILKPEDVSAAAHSLGRAGSGNLGPSGIKARIIAIAKRKGWSSKLPKAWQGGGDEKKESAQASQSTGPLKLIESASCLETIILREAKADYEIKLIAPGKGSSAFYPAEVLKRDGPQVFKASTHVYLNHPTAAEEAARPEGDVTNLAGVLTTGAIYHESHAKGPGLYARMKVFADHAQMVEEKAAHVGMSIRASGIAEAGGQLKEGLPVLKQLTGAESVDVVTKAGAGGMILSEAAKPQIPIQEAAMDATEVNKLIESAVKAAQAPLLERALRGDAREAAAKILAPLALIEKGKARVIDTLLSRELPMKDGALDLVKFTEAVNAEAKAEGAYVAELSSSGQVRGMGITQPPQVLTEDARKLQEAEAQRFAADTENVFSRLTNGNKTAAKNIAAREVAA